MAFNIIFEKKPFLKETDKTQSFRCSKNTRFVTSVQNDNGMSEIKEANICDHTLILKKGDKIQQFSVSDPQFFRVQKDVTFTRTKQLWLSVTRTYGSESPIENLKNLCNAIVDELHTAGAQYSTVKCTYIREYNGSYHYPFKRVDDTTYYDFFIKYQSIDSFHYYIFRTPQCPETVGSIANLQYLIYLDTLTMDICEKRVMPPLMIVAPNALINIFAFLLSKWGNYQKKPNHKYYDEKLTVISNPYNPRLGGTEKTINGQKAKAVTIIKNGVLLHLPLGPEESKIAGQKYIPNSFMCREVKGGTVSLDAMIKKTDEAFFIHELYGEMGADGNFSGLVKNGFLVKNGEFVARLSDMPITFNVLNIFNQIIDISSELVVLGNLIFPYICFQI